MDVISVLNVILLISASLLCLALIFYLSKITKSFEEIKNNVKGLAVDLKPLIQSTTELSEKLTAVTSEVRGQIQMTHDLVMNVKQRVETVLGFEEKIRRTVEEPVMGLLKNFQAVINGINAFRNAYKKH